MPCQSDGPGLLAPPKRPRNDPVDSLYLSPKGICRIIAFWSVFGSFGASISPTVGGPGTETYYRIAGFRALGDGFQGFSAGAYRATNFSVLQKTGPR